MAAQYSPNLLHLHKCYAGPYSGAILEGSSRSVKTWSSIDFIIFLCSTHSGIVINIIKETYNSFKTTLYDDFNRRLPQFGLPSPFDGKQEVKSFMLLGNKINLVGADQYKEGATCDFFYMNEALDIPKRVFDMAEQRCRKFWWGDYNPKFTEHWLFDAMDRRKDIGFLRTTFLDNPYISDMEKRKILSYEPTHPDDRHLDFEKRRPHPINIEQGTADDHSWNVYGLGLRSAPEGLIFRTVTWVKEFPANIEKVWYGIDWGYENDPTCLTKTGLQGRNFYSQILHYAPTPSFNEAEPVLKMVAKGNTIWADPSGEYGDRGYISLARKHGYRVLAVNTFPGSIMFGIGLIKKYKVHLIDCPEWRKEQGAYKYREVNGIRIDQPVDAHNHAWDSTRMTALANLAKMV